MFIFTKKIALIRMMIMTCLGLVACQAASPSAPTATNRSVAASLLITAAVETAQVPHDGDAADDPAIWIHPDNPARSTVIGTDKLGGLAVYDLTGQQLQYLPDGRKNNVDLRAGFSLGGQAIALVTASDRTDRSISIYRVNPDTRLLENVSARRIITGAGYGACMYHSAVTGKFYYLVNSEQGLVEQWELFDNGTGKVDAAKVRSFEVGGRTEGCVADDQLGHLYIGEEAVGIWKYGAEPTAGDVRSSVDTTNPGGHLKEDVEGLALYDAGDARGYLIVSSQGSDSFVVYRRDGSNEYVATFRITDGNGIDHVSGTDGIEVTSANLGPAFGQGVFIAQDGVNEDMNQNFKLVAWEAIIDRIGQLGPPGSASTTAHRNAPSKS